MRDEADIESKFGAELYKWGAKWGIKTEYLKYEVRGRRGFPDRMIIWGPNGNFMFIEWKRPGKKPGEIQKFVHSQLRKLGVEVRVYDDWRIAMAEVTALISSEGGADPWDENDRQPSGREVVFASGQRKDSDCFKELFSAEEFRLGRCVTCGCPIASHHD